MWIVFWSKMVRFHDFKAMITFLVLLDPQSKSDLGLVEKMVLGAGGAGCLSLFINNDTFKVYFPNCNTMLLLFGYILQQISRYNYTPHDHLYMHLICTRLEMYKLYRMYHLALRMMFKLWSLYWNPQIDVYQNNFWYIIIAIPSVKFEECCFTIMLELQFLQVILQRK